MAVKALGFESDVDRDLVGHATGCGLALYLDLERHDGKSRFWKKIWVNWLKRRMAYGQSCPSSSSPGVMVDAVCCKMDKTMLGARVMDYLILTRSQTSICVCSFSTLQNYCCVRLDSDIPRQCPRIPCRLQRCICQEYNAGDFDKVA
jgi:hypothetical protein